MGTLTLIALSACVITMGMLVWNIILATKIYTLNKKHRNTCTQNKRLIADIGVKDEKISTLENKLSEATASQPKRTAKGRFAKKSE